MIKLREKVFGLALGVAMAFGASSVANANSWQGFYIGIHAGHSWADVGIRDLDAYNGPAPASSFGYDIDNLFAGGQLGFNFHVGSNLVLGIEGELGAPPVDGGAQFPPYVGVRTPLDSLSTVDGNLYGTIAARLGFSAGAFLIYAKGGWGFVDVDVNFIDPDPIGAVLVSGTSASETLSGAVYGGGVEWAISKMMSLKVEYLHFDVGDTVTVNAVQAGGAQRRFAHDIDDIDTVKVGVNLRFHREHVAPMK